MNKELIEQIAIATSKDISFEHRAPLTDVSIVTFATRFLARIDAERGKDAFGYVGAHIAKWMAEGAKGCGTTITKHQSSPDDVPLYLSPTIPEGMALVKARDLRYAEESLDEGDAQTTSLLLKAMIAAAGVKL